MKTILYSFLLVFLSFPLTGNAQQSVANQLIGTWVFNYESSFSKMKTQTKAHYDSIPMDRKTKIENAYRGRTIAFKKDGSFTQTLSDGRTSLGTWAYNKETNNIEITSPKGRVYYQKVKKLTVTTVVLKPKSIGKGEMMISEMHFTKIKKN